MEHSWQFNILFEHHGGNAVGGFRRVLRGEGVHLECLG